MAPGQNQELYVRAAGWLAAVNQPPRELTHWLGRLYLLYGVPFDHLVPDARMLPLESLRFFAIDENWLNSLLDGALSLGTHCLDDAAYYQTMRDEVLARVQEAAAQVRVPNQSQGLLPRAGMLLRSTIVSGWPGLEVRATGQNGPVAVLRMERLAPDVLLCIFGDLPTGVEIAEPAEAVHFGCSEAQTIHLRSLKNQGASLGSEVPLVMRNDQGVLDMAATREAVQQALQRAGELDGGSLGPAGLAIQMVQAPRSQTFRLPPAAPVRLPPLRGAPAAPQAEKTIEQFLEELRHG